MIRASRAFAVYLATSGCSGEAIDNPHMDGKQETASVAQALTADGLDGLCLHVARNEVSPRYATLVMSTSDVRARDPEELPDPAQIWCFEAVAGQSNTYRITNPSSGAYLDAHESSRYDYRVVVRTYQANATQQWVVSGGPSFFRIQQASSQRYLDSHFGSKDEQFVTRSFQNNTTQEFNLIEPNETTPDPDSCRLESASASLNQCEAVVYCGFFTGYVYVSCDGIGDNQSNCDCWVSSSSEPGSMTVPGQGWDACSAALDACLAE